MVNVFTGGTADEVWVSAQTSLQNSQSALQESRNGNTKEALHCCFEIKDPRQRVVFARKPIINPAFAIAEVFWILAGRNDAKFLNYWNSQLPKYAGKGDEYYGAYGHRLRKTNDIDQLYQAYTALKHNPKTRQVVLQIWHSQLDLPRTNGQPRAPDIPCNLMAILKLRDGRLHWTQVMRSNDLYLGTPHNFFQFTCLQEIMAGWLDVNVGNYIHIADSLHYYEHDVGRFSSERVSFPYNEDDLRLNYSTFHEVLQKCCATIDQLTEPTLSKQDLKDTLSVNIPQQYKNLLSLCIAEGARKRRRQDIANLALQHCTNKMLVYLWQCWLAKLKNA